MVKGGGTEVRHSVFANNGGFGAVAADNHPSSLKNSILTGNAGAVISGTNLTEFGNCGDVGVAESEPLEKVISGEYFLRDSLDNACLAKAEWGTAWDSYEEVYVLSVFSDGGLDFPSPDPGVHFDPASTWIREARWASDGTVTWDVHNRQDCFFTQWQVETESDWGLPTLAASPGGIVHANELESILQGTDLLQLNCRDAVRGITVSTRLIRETPD